MDSFANQDPLQIAEDAPSFMPLLPGQSRHETGGAVLVRGAATHYWYNHVSRIRLSPSDADRRIDDIRQWFATRGRASFTWWVGAAATPGDLIDRLVAHGASLEPNDPVQTPMVLDREPPPGPDDVEIRSVDTLEDFRVMWEIDYEGFRMPESDREEARARLAEDWEHVRADPRRLRYLALIDGEPIGYGMMVILTDGLPYLNGGATLPSARGRGAYRALVRARWDEAVRRGAASLVVTAGKHSRPILERLGFRAGPPTHVLVDDSTA
jgi:GNAT superfamily N-acetyltransferase